MPVVPIPAAASFPTVVQVGERTIVTAGPSEVVTASGFEALDQLDRLTPGWWAGFFTYDLGRSIERVTPRLVADPGLPDLVFARYDARLVLGDGPPRFEGQPRARPQLEALLPANPSPSASGSLELGPATSSLDRGAFEAGVRAIVELLEAGECYQVNLTRRLQWESQVDPIALYHKLTMTSRAPHRALMVLPTPRGEPIAVVSASPERFLAWNDREIETRPIKGTARDAGPLRTSAKDRAENVMIVDLARNDLGRVCEPGSVHVPSLCAVEAHPGLHHLVSTVCGRRRSDVGLATLLRATFPPASVTGAPKPRVLQAIEDLEPVRRGVYCGALGWFDTERDVGDLAVAIRTFTLRAGHTSLGVGSGIVADSDPGLEWHETELKVARVLRAVDSPRSSPSRDRVVAK